MDQIFQITAVCLIGAVLTALLRKNGTEMALLLTLAVAAVVLLALGGAVRDITDLVTRMLHAGSIAPEQGFRQRPPLRQGHAKRRIERVARSGGIHRIDRIGRHQSLPLRSGIKAPMLSQGDNHVPGSLASQALRRSAAPHLRRLTILCAASEEFRLRLVGGPKFHQIKI